MNCVITNALIRCTREDQKASEWFECVQPELSIWVLELPDELIDIFDELSRIKDFLKDLREGSHDFTLLIDATIDDQTSLKIPSTLSGLAGECGFSIEILASSE